MREMRAVVLVVACAVLLSFGLPGVSEAVPLQKETTTGPLKVTVEYTGPGKVDKEHRLWIWLFDTPTIDTSSIPVAADLLSENEGTVTFESLPETVYIVVAFDEKGGYDGTSGPPPSGTPVMVYGEQGIPTGVKTGEDATVRVSFDDSVRMP